MIAPWPLRTVTTTVIIQYDTVYTLFRCWFARSQGGLGRSAFPNGLQQLGEELGPLVNSLTTPVSKARFFAALPTARSIGARSRWASTWKTRHRMKLAAFLVKTSSLLPYHVKPTEPGRSFSPGAATVHISDLAIKASSARDMYLASEHLRFGPWPC